MGTFMRCTASVYRSLSESQKLDLLQETVNRDAAARGEVGSPKVRFENLPSGTDGYAEKGIISVNRDLAVNGTRTATYQGKTLQHTINDYNIQSLVTVLHENVHCCQDQIIDGTIRNADPQLAAEYRANDFTISVVQQGNNLDFGSQYLTGETSNGYYFYYFQATERDAFRWSEEEASRIVQELTAKYGTEPSFEAYEKTLQANGYSVMEAGSDPAFSESGLCKRPEPGADEPVLWHPQVCGRQNRTGCQERNGTEPASSAACHDKAVIHGKGATEYEFPIYTDDSRRI